MARKRRRRRARKRTHNPTKKRAVRRRRKRANPTTVRAKASNPRRRRRRVRRASVVMNPRRRRRSRKRRHNPCASPRAVRANPRRRRSGRRRHRRNPNLPPWAAAGAAALLGLLAYGVTAAVSFSAAQRLDPKMQNLNTVRYVVSALVFGGGLFLATKKPLYGVAVAGAAAAVAIGGRLTALVGKVTDKKPSISGMGRVYDSDDAMGAAYAPHQLGMGAAYENPTQLGDVYNPAYYPPAYGY